MHYLFRKNEQVSQLFDKAGATTESLNDIKKFLLSIEQKVVYKKRSLICLNTIKTLFFMFSVM